MKFSKSFKQHIHEDDDSFKKQMGNVLNIDPSHVSEDYLDRFIVANPVIITRDGGKYKLNGNIEFKVVFRGENIVTIQDVSKPDPKNKQLSDFPHGINPSSNFGKKFTLGIDDYNNLIQWRIPKPENPADMMGGMGGGGMGGGLGL